MALKFAINEVQHTCPITEKRAIAAPGSIFELADDQVEWCESKGAVRDPDDRELLSYKQSMGLLIDTTLDKKAAAPVAKPAATVATPVAKPAATVATPAAKPADDADKVAAAAAAAGDDGIG